MYPLQGTSKERIIHPFFFPPYDAGTGVVPTGAVGPRALRRARPIETPGHRLVDLLFKLPVCPHQSTGAESTGAESTRPRVLGLQNRFAILHR